MENFKISIIIPAYNEEKRIGKTLDFICDYLKKQSYNWEILVVDDGSVDRTKEVVLGKKKTYSFIHYLSYGENRGKGYAIKFGVQKAKGDYILFADADNATPFSEIEKLLPYKDDYDMVVGSRYLKEPTPVQQKYFQALFKSFKELLIFLLTGKVPETTIKKKQTWFRQLMSRGGNFLFVLVLGLAYADTRCGFKLFKSNVAKYLFPKITIERWGFDTEILAIARKKKYKAIEVPVEWYDIEGGEISKSPAKEALKSIKELFVIKWKSMTGKYR